MGFHNLVENQGIDGQADVVTCDHRLRGDVIDLLTKVDAIGGKPVGLVVQVLDHPLAVQKGDDEVDARIQGAYVFSQPLDDHRLALGHLLDSLKDDQNDKECNRKNNIKLFHPLLLCNQQLHTVKRLHGDYLVDGKCFCTFCCSTPDFLANPHLPRRLEWIDRLDDHGLLADQGGCVCVDPTLARKAIGEDPPYKHGENEQGYGKGNQYHGR